MVKSNGQLNTPLLGLEGLFAIMAELYQASDLCEASPLSLSCRGSLIAQLTKCENKGSTTYLHLNTWLSSRQPGLRDSEPDWTKS